MNDLVSFSPMYSWPESFQMERLLWIARRNSDAEDILAAYEGERQVEGFVLADFVEKHFNLPQQYASGFTSDTSRSVQEHITLLWDVLTREPEASKGGSLIPLPNSYIVPGGDFGKFTIGIVISRCSGFKFRVRVK